MAGPHNSIEPNRQYAAGLIDQLEAMVSCLTDLEQRSQHHEAYIVHRTGDHRVARNEARKLAQAATAARATVNDARRAVEDLCRCYTSTLRITE